MKKTFITVLLAALLVSPVAASDEAQPPVEVFVTNWCPYCRQLESFLKKSDIGYKRYDVEHDEKGAELFSDLNGEGVPLVRVGKNVIRGYDPDAIVRALKVRGR